MDCKFDDPFSPLDEHCHDRIFWFRLSLLESDGSSSEQLQLVVCAFYHRPGGDLDTWRQILKSFSVLKKSFPQAKFIFAGDSNTHFSFLVDHPFGCTCCHCKQCSDDKRAEELLGPAGLQVFNTLDPTHESGSVIDLLLFLCQRGDQHLVAQITVETQNIAQSDHRLVFVELQAEVDGNHKHAIPKVSWGSTAQWALCLQHVSAQLLALVQGIQELLGRDEWRPPQCGGSTGKKLRRLVLDLCAWNYACSYIYAGR